MDKNYCPDCDAFLPGEHHKPMCEFPKKLEKLQKLLEKADREYMTEDIPQSDFAEDLLDDIAAIFPFERTQDYYRGEFE